jgi:cytochrome c oxidase assembly protein subunit 15
MAETRAGDFEGVAVVGFGTSVAMWFLGYLCRLPGVDTPGWLVGSALVAMLAAGGAVAARTSGAGWKAGAAAGLVSSGINLLVLGSVVGGSAPDEIRSGALAWVLGSLLAGALLAGVAGALGTVRPRAAREVDWTAAFSLVAGGGTLLLVVVGGLVTSHDAGLAVVDWPNSFGYAMFLYPLSRMTGGIYYEHAHRLFGTLVGLATVALAFRLVRTEARRWVKTLAGLAVAAVVAQGILGGLRVTGRFTLATAPEQTAPNQALAAVHGVSGQLFFALLVVLAVVTSSAWRRRAVSSSADDQRWLGVGLVAAVVVQLILGSVLRHFGEGLLVHATAGSGVFGLAVLAGVRGRRVAEAVPPLRTLSTALLVLVTLQVMLGVGAWLTTAARQPGTPAPPLEVLAATAHQVNGALVLGCAVAFAIWIVGSAIDRGATAE